MKCPKCSTEMSKGTGNYHFHECGLENVWLKDWLMFICASCNVRMPILPHGKLITEKITEALVRLPFKLDGHAIRFLRKSMGLKSEDLAERIGVHRVEVSRWENDKASIDPYHDLKLRILAITFVLPSVEQDKAKEEIMNILEHENIEKKVTSTPRILVPA